jgi:hypothetical protein
MRRAMVLLALAAMACSEQRAIRAQTTSSCLMPQPDANVWQACAPDATLRGDLASEGAPPAADSGASSVACEANACASPDHPCVPADEGEGYICLGQYASWPMPESLPQAHAAPHYSVMVEVGVVLDEVTGLVWQRELPETYAGCSGADKPMRGATCSWDEARRYCERLRLAGRRWRLPSLIELVSLLDFSHSAELTRPLHDPDAFSPDLERDMFWSSTSLEARASQRNDADDRDSERTDTHPNCVGGADRQRFECPRQ